KHASEERLHQSDERNALSSDEDALLAKLIELEARLEVNLQQKESRQKPKLQRQWREEIARINLSLDM
ncbi:hypothetical protein, partial [Parendozoicomonas sp. Alg238-R29]|uniref:hypothetical protein n=1 Tax=Parendozoicomonas sp. Alg238-R29 TaxID=2993446 RepID=UPI00248E7B6F